MYLSVRIGTFLNRSTGKYYKLYKKEEGLVISFQINSISETPFSTSVPHLH